MLITQQRVCICRHTRACICWINRVSIADWQTVLEGLFYYLAHWLKTLNLSSEYLIDSFPVALCDKIGIKPSPLVRGETYPGKIASKRRFFDGFRVQVIATTSACAILDSSWGICRWDGFANNAN